MAITEEQQLAYVKDKFCARIMEVASLAEMVTFVSNIDGASVKAFLQSKLQNAADETRTKGTELSTLADDLETLKDSL